MNTNTKLSWVEASRLVEEAFERHKLGEVANSAAVYRRVLSNYPNHPAALHYLGLAAQQCGRPGDAVALLRQSVAVAPNDPRVHNHLGQVLIALEDKLAAQQCFEQALAIDPAHVEALNNLANVIRTRDLCRAIALYRRAVELRPTAAFALYNLAKALNEDRRHDEALQYYERAVAADPTHFKARFNLGVLQEQRGNFKEAIVQYLEVQRLRPQNVSSLANLIASREYEPPEDLVKRAESFLTSTSASDEDRIKLHRGLGKHYDRTGHFDRAFGHFQRSKDLVRARSAPFELARTKATFDRLIEAFDADALAPHAALGSGSRRMIFIVGLPRSGTTLTEQILASHRHVRGGGEVGEIPAIAKSLRPDYPGCVPRMTSDELCTLADQYLRVIDGICGVDATRVTDKMPLNSIHLGLVAKLFPRATIVYVRRDPRDVAVSSLVELFEFENDYTTRLDDFGSYVLEHDRLMRHWQRVIPMKILELRYEDLVAEPESTTRALLDHCGLEWDPACLSFHSTERTVQTPSRWQVRQPMYSHSVGRWRNYARHLRPLLDVLELEDDGVDERGSAHVLSSQVHLSPATGVACPSALRRPVFIVSAPRSGSTLLFETIATSLQFSTIGGEAHWLVERHPPLQPGAQNEWSNRLTAVHASPELRRVMIQDILSHLVDRDGQPADENCKLIFLEKTPKNALRIPFFDALFPDARFLWLWRDPRENISSILESWRSGRWVTYRELPGWDGPWSMLLPPHWTSLRGRPIIDVAAHQWRSANDTIGSDLTRISRDRWHVVSYDELVASPRQTVGRVMSWLGLEVDDALGARLVHPLPPSRYTHTLPAAEKWRVNEAEVNHALPSLEGTWRELARLTGSGDKRP